MAPSAMKYDSVETSTESVSVAVPRGPVAATVMTFVPATSGMSPAYHGVVPAAVPANPRSVDHVTVDTVPPAVPPSVIDAPGAVVAGAKVGEVMVMEGGRFTAMPVRISTT